MSIHAFEHFGWPGTINGTSLYSECWTVLNLKAVPQDAPASPINVELYGEPGTLGRPLVENEVTFDLECLMHGLCSPEGVDYDDPADGLEANQDLWRERFYLPTRDAEGCLSMTAVKRSGTVLGGAVQPLPPIWGDGEFDCAFTMSIVIPRGCLLPVGGP